jgi:methylenetetrahydrofolate dehydrogenase (NADP+)/methenyltetrahydrofolate cyclohydrolase
VQGILLQLPLPSQLEKEKLIEALAPEKDVDALHPWNQGKLLLGEKGLRPCTPLGVMRLIEESRVVLTGKRAVVIGRSLLVGKPVALMLLGCDATVTCCHSRTERLADEVQAADIVVAAVGHPGVIKGAWIKKGHGDRRGHFAIQMDLSEETLSSRGEGASSVYYSVPAELDR